MRDVLQDLRLRQPTPDLSIAHLVGDTAGRGVQAGAAGFAVLVHWLTDLTSALMFAVAGLMTIDLLLGMLRAWRHRSEENPFRISRAVGDSLSKLLIYLLGYVSVALLGFVSIEVSITLLGVDPSPGVAIALVATLGLYGGTEGLSIAGHLQALDSPVHTLVRYLSQRVRRSSGEGVPDPDPDPESDP